MWQRLPDEPTEALSGGAMVAPAHEATPAAVELAHDGDRALAHDTTRLADRRFKSRRNTHDTRKHTNRRLIVMFMI